MMDAIVYVSESGDTKRYAQLLGNRTGLSVYELKTEKKELPKSASVIFLGWLMAGTVKGYKKAKRRFDVFSKNA